MTKAPRVTTPALRLARIALGCGNFGGVGSAPEFFGQGLSQDQALAVMDAAWQAGITDFDTADAYGGGRSEASIGHWIATRGVRPQLTTRPATDGGRADRAWPPSASPASCGPAWTGSAWTTSSLYLAHDFDPDVPLADTFGAFEQARSQGLSAPTGEDFDTAQLHRLARRRAPRAIQNSHRGCSTGRDCARLLDLCRGAGRRRWRSAGWRAALAHRASTGAVSRSPRAPG